MFAKILKVAASPFIAAYFFGMIALIPVGFVMQRVTDRLMKRRLRRVGRCCLWEDVEQRVANAGGSLIIDELSLGWNHVHTWWTSDDVRAKAAAHGLSPVPLEAALEDPSQSRFWQWCERMYTSESTGSALLVEEGYSYKQRLARDRRIFALRDRFPALEVIEVWSGCHRTLLREARRRRTESGLNGLT